MCVTSCCLAQAKWPQTFIRVHAPEWPVASIVSILISERCTPPAELSKTYIFRSAHVRETMSPINSSPHILNSGKPTVNSSPTSLNQRQVNICPHYGIWDQGCLSDHSQICKLVSPSLGGSWVSWVVPGPSVVSGVHCPGDPGLPLGQVFPCHGHCAQVKSSLFSNKKKISLMIKSLPGLPLFSLHLVGNL